MLEKTYSHAWAQRIYEEFTRKHARATKKFRQFYDVSEDIIIELIRRKQKKWGNYKLYIKILEKYLVNTKGRANKKHLELPEKEYLGKTGLCMSEIRSE